MPEKKNINQPTDCKNKKHNFIVTKWMSHGGKQKAIEMRCTHCLMPMNLEEIESIEFKESEGI